MGARRIVMSGWQISWPAEQLERQMSKNAGQLAKQMSRNVARIGAKMRLIAGRPARQKNRSIRRNSVSMRFSVRMNITRMIFLMLCSPRRRPHCVALGSAYPHHQISWVPSVWLGLQHWSPQLLQWHTWLFNAEGLATPSKSLFFITVPYEGVLIGLIWMRYKACALFMPTCKFMLTPDDMLAEIASLRKFFCDNFSPP